MEIRKIQDADGDEVKKLLREVITAGDSNVFDGSRSDEDIYRYWVSAEKETYVAIDNGLVAGSFYLKENQPDRGSHIANAGFMVPPAFRGRGLGRQLAEFALDQAKRNGFSAMQFNFVISTNTAAVALWKSLGFTICGEVPKAFLHKEKGLVSVYIMYREL